MSPTEKNGPWCFTYLWYISFSRPKFPGAPQPQSDLSTTPTSFNIQKLLVQKSQIGHFFQYQYLGLYMMWLEDALCNTEISKPRRGESICMHISRKHITLHFMVTNWWHGYLLNTCWNLWQDNAHPHSHNDKWECLRGVNMLLWLGRTLKLSRRHIWDCMSRMSSNQYWQQVPFNIRYRKQCLRIFTVAQFHVT